EVAKRWFASRIIDPASEIRYETAYRLHVEPVFARRAVKAIKPSDIQGWISELSQRRGPSTVAAGFLLIQGVLDLAVADESIRKTPTKSPIVHIPPPEERRVRAWSDESLYGVIDSHSTLFRPIPIVGAGCGLRQGEVFGVAREDIDADEQLLHVRRQIKK